MSRKTASFSQLLDYIAGEEKVAAVPITHNILSDASNLRCVAQEFMINADYCPPRKNGVVLYHEVLSLSGNDRDQVTVAMLNDLAQKYITLRANGALVFAAIHFDKNPHVHLVISGNLAFRPEKLRLSKSAFNQVKRELERYQKEQYPQLVYSVVFESGTTKERPLMGTKSCSPTEYERQRRLCQQGKGDVSQKEIIREQVLSSVIHAASFQQFFQQLHEQMITVYTRSQRLTGVIVGGKKYRFTTLGLKDVVLNALKRWERVPKRQRLLANIAGQKTQLQYCGQGLEI